MIENLDSLATPEQLQESFDLFKKNAALASMDCHSLTDDINPLLHDIFLASRDYMAFFQIQLSLAYDGGLLTQRDRKDIV